MNEAIKLAVKGGWIPRGLNAERKPVSWIWQAAINRSKFYERFVLDPQFWVALSKALGWELIDYCRECDSATEGWKYYAHLYFDLVLTGGDTEKFWQDLINQSGNSPQEK
jgi:hypothetical protein